MLSLSFSLRSMAPLSLWIQQGGALNSPFPLPSRPSPYVGLNCQRIRRGFPEGEGESPDGTRGERRKCRNAFQKDRFLFPPPFLLLSRLMFEKVPPTNRPFFFFSPPVNGSRYCSSFSPLIPPLLLSPHQKMSSISRVTRTKKRVAHL